MEDQAQLFSVPSQPPVSPQRDEGLIKTATQVFTSPTLTLGRIARQRPLRWALIVIVVSAIIQRTGMLAAYPSPSGDATPASEVIVGIISSPVLLVSGIAIVAGIYQLLSMILGGKGSYGGLFSGLAFAGVPTVLTMPPGLLVMVIGPAAGNIIYFSVWVLVAIWVMGLHVVVIHENHQFSTLRAVAVFLIPVVVVAVVVIPIATVILIFALVGGPP